MKIKKVIFKVAMMAMMVFAAVGYNAKIAGATNASDTSWNFYLSVSDTSDRYTPERSKQDYSKVYFNWQSKSGVYSLRVMVEGTTGNGVYVNCTNGKTFYTVTYTGQYSLSNLVKENGYSYARLRMRSNNGTGTASGLWSPDSTVTFPSP